MPAAVPVVVPIVIVPAAKVAERGGGAVVVATAVIGGIATVIAAVVTVIRRWRGPAVATAQRNREHAERQTANEHRLCHGVTSSEDDGPPIVAKPDHDMGKNVGLSPADHQMASAAPPPKRHG